MRSTHNWAFWKVTGLIILGHILCDNIWWILGWEHAMKWYYMPIAVTIISVFIALVVERKIHHVH